MNILNAKVSKGLSGNGVRADNNNKNRGTMEAKAGGELAPACTNWSGTFEIRPRMSRVIEGSSFC